MALPMDARRLLLALWQARTAGREVNLSALAGELGFDAATMLSAYTALDRYRYTRQKGVSSERGLPYPREAELTSAGVAAAAKLVEDGEAKGSMKRD